MAITVPGSKAKLAGESDPAQILEAVERELLARRLQRRSPSGAPVLVLRIFCVLLLLGLFAAGLGAMWYLQSVAAQHAPPAHASP